MLPRSDEKERYYRIFRAFNFLCDLGFDMIERSHGELLEGAVTAAGGRKLLDTLPYEIVFFCFCSFRLGTKTGICLDSSGAFVLSLALENFCT